MTQARRHTLILGAADIRSGMVRAQVDGAHHVLVLDAATLPFTRVNTVDLPQAPRTIVIDGLERAFPDNQAGATRLVLTQSTYLMQTWVDAVGNGHIVAAADPAALERVAPEARKGRGPWRHFSVVNSQLPAAQVPSPPVPRPKVPSPQVPSPEVPRPQPTALCETLAAAYAAADPAARLAMCRDVAERHPDSSVAQLALASAYREHRDLRARDALERAVERAPDWAAAQYELGKLWLALDDLLQARDAFARAGELMPTFSAAFSNLGAVLGELGNADAAAAAFRQALEHDPRSHTLLSNVAVVAREEGRLDESEQALRDAVSIEPGFVFGWYNLGHTLFLAGRYADAVDAYEEGARRDPQRNPRQACRLAAARIARGEGRGEGEMWEAIARAPAGEREDLMLEAYEIVYALVVAHPERAAAARLLDRLASKIGKSE